MMSTEYITDPLVCLCKLAILSFMPPGTKLAFGEHVIHIQGYTRYQWIERSLSRDSRADISLLNTPIASAIKYYLIDDPSEDTLTLTRYAIKGLVKMRDDTYADAASVRLVLQYYINHLTAALEGRWLESELLATQTCHVELDNPSYADTTRTVARMLTDADQRDRVPGDARALITCTHSLLRSRDAAFVQIVSPRVDIVE